MSCNCIIFATSGIFVTLFRFYRIKEKSRWWFREFKNSSKCANQWKMNQFKWSWQRCIWEAEGETWGVSVGSKFKSSFRWLQVQVWAVGKLRRHHQHQDPIGNAEASAVQRRVPGHCQGVQTLLPQSEEGQRWESSVTFNSHCNRRRHDQITCSFWWCFHSKTVQHGRDKNKKATLSSDNQTPPTSRKWRRTLMMPLVCRGRSFTLIQRRKVLEDFRRLKQRQHLTLCL